MDYQEMLFAAHVQEIVVSRYNKLHEKLSADDPLFGSQYDWQGAIDEAVGEIEAVAAMIRKAPQP